MSGRAVVTWIVLVLIGIANGAIRQETYGRKVSELSAQQISTVTLMVGLLVGSYFMMRRYVTDVTTRTLLAIGAAWAVGSILFEFGFGRYVAGDSWSTLLDAYNLPAGRLWIAIPLTMLLSPIIVRWAVNHSPVKREPLQA